MRVQLARLRLSPIARSLERLAAAVPAAGLRGALLALVLPACALHGGDQLTPTCAELSTAAPPPLPRPERTLRVAGETFDILSEGPETGQVVLLLQGFPDRSYEYRAALPRLANVGYRAIAPVRRGASSLPNRVLRDQAQQVLELADALGLDRFHVAGGELAWSVARLVPQRILSVASTAPAQIAAVAALERASPACAQHRLAD